MIDPTQARIDDLSANVRLILTSVGDIQKETVEIRAILDRNTEDIEKHIKRTDALETLVTDLVIPIRVLKFLLVLAGGLSTAAGALFAFIKLAGLLRKLF